MATQTGFQVPGFDDTRETWDSYIVRIGAYFLGTTFTDVKTKRELIVSALCTRTIEVLSDSCASRPVNDLLYKETVERIT